MSLIISRKAGACWLIEIGEEAQKFRAVAKCTEGYLKFIEVNQVVNHPVVLDRGNHLLGNFLQLGFLQAAFPPFTYVVGSDGKLLLKSRQTWNAKTFNDPSVTLVEVIEKLIQQHLAQP